LKKHNIHYFNTENYDTKACIAERFIRTLKERLWRYFTYTDTRRYVDIIHDLVYSYNHSYHRSIKCKPVQVCAENQEEVWQNLYGDLTVRQPKLFEGDLVRLSVLRRPFRKGYLPRWTLELFRISKALAGDPPFYKIEDLGGEILQGTFYEEELQKVHKNDNVFRIESILKRRKRGKQLKYFVKWFGYPSKFNSWVSAKDFVRYA